MFKKYLVISSVSIIVAFGINTVSGHSGATGMVKERMDFMKDNNEVDVTSASIFRTWMSAENRERRC